MRGKKMERIRKIFAMVLTLSMIMGMSSMAFADNKKPEASDTAPVTVSNVEIGATVTAYRIVSADYTAEGFTGFHVVKKGSISDEKTFQPTSDEITTLAKNTDGLESRTLTGSETQGTGLTDFTGNLEAGYWMVLVTGTVEEVYNPMLIGVYYDTQGSGSSSSIMSGPVDANANWTLKVLDAYAKSTKPTVTKEMTGATGAGIKNAEGDDVAIGDDVDFKITTAIPSYSAQYERVIVQIVDKLSQGLSLNASSVDVSVNGANVKASESTYSLESSESGFTISFNSAYAIKNGGKEVVVTYRAKLTEAAGLNFDPNTNTATLNYTNDPSDINKTQSANDVTYTYTFAIDSMLYGSSSITTNKQTTEIRKVGEVTVSEDGETVTSKNALPGAEFTLTNINTDRRYVTSSNADGYLAFTGLDAGDYTLVETKAPAGYSLEGKTHTVNISANYNTDGTLASYEIKIDGEVTGHYQAEYEGEGIIKTVTKVTVSGDQMDIANTKLTSLPSTGGIGTTIFTIVGCVIMIGAAGLFFASRRRSSAQK